MASFAISPPRTLMSVRRARPAQSRTLPLSRALFTHMRVTHGTRRASRHGATLQEVLELAQEIETKTSDEVEHWDGGGFEDEDDEPGMTASEVKKVLKVLCSETEVAQIDLKSGSFELRVTRLGAGPLTDVGDVFATMDSAGSAGFAPTGPAFASSNSFDLPADFRMPTDMSIPTSTTLSSMDDFEDDECVETSFLFSKKVGMFYRARTAKKRPNSKPLVQVGDTVKADQVVGFVEQVGHMYPVKATEAGEVVAFYINNAEPVQFGEPILELIPR